jgi:predicted DNA-binding transcriptional regulator YafY
MEEKETKVIKMQEMQEILDNIIEVFKINRGQLSTKELYEQMRDDYHFEKTLRSLEITYLPKLENGVIGGVKFTKKLRGKHRLRDNRASNTETKKMPHNEQIFGEERAYLRLALQAIKDLPTLSNKHYKAIEARFQLHEPNTPYYIESQEAEPLEVSQFDTSELIYAITHDCLVEFKYTDISSKDIYVVEPYKIITFDGLWYLFGKDIHDSETPYKTWRLKYIVDTDIDRTSKYNLADESIEKILTKAHSADFIVDNIDNATVKSLHIEVKVSKYIGDKIQLPGEIDEILNDDGSRTIICDVSSIKEIDRDIKAWLPHIEIIQPSWYKKQIKEELQGYLDGFER